MTGLIETREPSQVNFFSQSCRKSYISDQAPKTAKCESWTFIDNAQCTKSLPATRSRDDISSNTYIVEWLQQPFMWHIFFFCRTYTMVYRWRKWLCIFIVKKLLDIFLNRFQFVIRNIFRFSQVQCKVLRFQAISWVSFYPICHKLGPFMPFFMQSVLSFSNINSVKFTISPVNINRICILAVLKSTQTCSCNLNVA